MNEKYEAKSNNSETNVQQNQTIKLTIQTVQSNLVQDKRFFLQN